MAMQNLLNKVQQYYPHQENLIYLRQAYALAAQIHQGQRRLNGEPYLNHVLQTAHLIADIKLDLHAVSAALLHDLVESREGWREVKKKGFPSEVIFLLEKILQLKSIPTRRHYQLAPDNIQFMILAAAEDVRPVLIRLAEKIHNLQTLEGLDEQKQQIALDKVIEIYAPLASRLGAYYFKRLLEDEALRYLHPQAYDEITAAVNEVAGNKDFWLGQFHHQLEKVLQKAGLKFTLKSRIKHKYSIFQKFQRRGRPEEETLRDFIHRYWDIVAFRVITEKEDDCYRALAAIEAVWPRGPDFNDYIAHPKPNGYRSLHTTIQGPEGIPVEVQIRTWEMHHYNEYGPAAHILYKARQNQRQADPRRLEWLRDLLKWQEELEKKKGKDFRLSFLSDRIFVLTPQSDVVVLPRGATPLDFAYKLHTELGNSFRGALVNGKLVPLDYCLQTGEVCEILRDKQRQGPSWDWLQIVRTKMARRKILRSLRQSSAEA